MTIRNDQKDDLVCHPDHGSPLALVAICVGQIRGYSALLAGLALLPQMGVIAAASFASGRVMSRVGPRLPMIVGLAAGGVGLLSLMVAGARTSFLLLVAPMLAAGFGMAFTMPAATAAVMGAAPDDRAGAASGVINTARQVGGVIGIALLGALVAHRATFISGLHVAVVLAGGSFLAGCALTLAAVPRRQPATPVTPSADRNPARCR